MQPCMMKVIVSVCSDTFKSDNCCINALLKIVLVFYCILVIFPFFMFYGLMFDVILALAIVVMAVLIAPCYFAYIYWGFMYSN